MRDHADERRATMCRHGLSTTVCVVCTPQVRLARSPVDEESLAALRLIKSKGYATHDVVDAYVKLILEE